MTEPALLFSMGRMPYWQKPLSMAENTLSKLLKYMIFGLLNMRVPAIWEYAPSVPWQAMMGAVGNRRGVSSMACSISLRRLLCVRVRSL